MADVDLLPCPFCGSADALRLRNTHTAAFWIACSEDDGGCGAKMSGEFFPGPPRRTRFCYDPEAPKGSKFDARTLDELHPEYRRAAESAIAAWNRRANVARANLAPLQAEIEALRAEVSGLRAARIAYANEFPATEDGDPDTGNIHANIRALKARAARLAEALADIRSRSAMNLAMNPNPFELTALLGDIHQIAGAALAKENKA